MNAVFTSQRVRKTLQTVRRRGLTMVLLMGSSLVFMTGCAVFETTPEDVHQKLTHPLDGHLYVPDSVDNRGEMAAY
ncbi:MAG TPA: hypothetical protein VLZ12_00480 [Verrucomicrobiae bacterium]|nr:hypothetical protein [Verrucomicrobiae bacterium]